MDINDLRSIITVLSMICFGGIVWWAYSDHRKEVYKEAANLPLEDDPPAATGGHNAGQANN
ncbi:MAG TPA: cbb3-type cytochrome c oxidase subunit 3 [Rhodocyclaceae bacterium]